MTASPSGLGLDAACLRMIDIDDVSTYVVGVRRDLAGHALRRLLAGKVKGRSLKVRCR